VSWFGTGKGSAEMIGAGACAGRGTMVMVDAGDDDEASVIRSPTIADGADVLSIETDKRFVM
jgi:hypothetical protein